MMLVDAPARLIRRITDWRDSIKAEGSVVYFSKSANLCRLNKAIQYVLRNEDANRVRVVHIYNQEQDIPRQLVGFCQVLDAVYPKIRVDVVFVQGRFGGPMIQDLSAQWGVSPNLMFITCPTSERVGKRIQDLDGVRVIMSHEEEALAEAFSQASFGALDRAISSEHPVSSLVES